MSKCRAFVAFGILALSNALRRGESTAKFGSVISPSNKNLAPVAVIMNPGGGVPAELYTENMLELQSQAEQAGLSMWVGILSYWGNVPLPIRLEANINNAIASMKTNDMPEDSPVFLAGHSMGGGVIDKAAQKFFEQGVVKGLILQASYLRTEHFPPRTESFTYPVPTFTVGAELNYGAARITRMAAARYRMRSLSLSVKDFPFVQIDGMNHMQFATGFEKADLKPEIDTATASKKVASLSVEFIANQMGLGGNSLLVSETQRTDAIYAPIWKAFELEGDALFGTPNQKSAPNSNCERGVCPTSSEWINFAQGYILGKQVLDRVEVKNNFADLNPWSLEPREGRKPFITENASTVQVYVMASNTASDFESDVKKPVSSNELLAKFVSRQEGNLKVLGTRTGNDGDFCIELNQMAVDTATQFASSQALQRFKAHGQRMVMGPTETKTIGPQWVSSAMKYEEIDGNMVVTSSRLFTEPGTSSISGNHYCKLLSPARALEWIYVDGLKKELYQIWET